MHHLQANSSSVLIAGSETTSSMLSGVTYLLLTNPDALRKVTEEVRTKFTSEEAITLTSVSCLSYMLACLNEALRSYPPVPFGMPRQVPKGGGIILGQHIPEDVSETSHRTLEKSCRKHKLTFVCSRLWSRSGTGPPITARSTLSSRLSITLSAFSVILSLPTIALTCFNLSLKVPATVLEDSKFSRSWQCWHCSGLFTNEFIAWHMRKCGWYSRVCYIISTFLWLIQKRTNGGFITTHMFSGISPHCT